MRTITLAAPPIDFERDVSLPRSARPAAPKVATVYVRDPSSIPVPVAPPPGVGARDGRGQVVVPGDPRYAVAARAVAARGTSALVLVERARQSGFTLETWAAEWLSANPNQVEPYFRAVLNGASLPAGVPSPNPDYDDRRDDYTDDDSFSIRGSKKDGIVGKGAIDTSTMLLLGGGALGLFLLLNKK